VQASPAATVGVVVFSTLSGMLFDAVHSAWTGVSGPQATLVIGGLGLLFQIVKWLIDRRAKLEK
jgi:hypothetical protein